MNELTVTLHLLGVAPTRIPARDLYDASVLVRQFQRLHGVGASGLGSSHGEVRVGPKLIARVSYNGRVWAPTAGIQVVLLEPDPLGSDLPATR